MASFATGEKEEAKYSRQVVEVSTGSKGRIILIVFHPVFLLFLPSGKEKEGLGKAKERAERNSGKTGREGAKKGACAQERWRERREEGCCQNSFCYKHREREMLAADRETNTRKTQKQIKHTHVHKAARECSHVSQEAAHSQGFACKCRRMRAQVDERDGGGRLVGRKRERGWEKAHERQI